ncbi:hypothetical protein NHF45_05355 [Maricaulaceae bacterium NA33B04]|nr:hypothetical protein [Maricaulaceae bacterium NA33B04]
MAKNITLAIDEDLLDKARVLAAMRRTTVNAMVRDFLQGAVDTEVGQDAITRELLQLSRASTADLGDVSAATTRLREEGAS